MPFEVSGIANVRATTLDEVLEHLRAPSPAVVIINSTAPITEIAAFAQKLRLFAPSPRVIVVHEDAHGESARTIEADACIHDVHEVDDLVTVVKAALADDLPDTEPHKAAEEVIEDGARR